MIQPDVKEGYEGQSVSLNDVVVKEIKVLGSRCGPFKAALDLMERNIIQLDKYISASFPLSKSREAFVKAKAKGALKVQLIIFWKIHMLIRIRISICISVAGLIRIPLYNVSLICFLVFLVFLVTSSIWMFYTFIVQQNKRRFYWYMIAQYIVYSRRFQTTLIFRKYTGNCNIFICKQSSKIGDWLIYIQ